MPRGYWYPLDAGQRLSIPIRYSPVHPRYTPGTFLLVHPHLGTLTGQETLTVHPLPSRPPRVCGSEPACANALTRTRITVCESRGERCTVPPPKPGCKVVAMRYRGIQAAQQAIQILDDELTKLKEADDGSSYVAQEIERLNLRRASYQRRIEVQRDRNRRHANPDPKAHLQQQLEQVTRQIERMEATGQYYRDNWDRNPSYYADMEQKLGEKITERRRRRRALLDEQSRDAGGSSGD